MDVDLDRPMPEPPRGGALYFGTFTKSFSVWTDVVILQKESDLLVEYKNWLTTALLPTGTMINVLPSDTGDEYVSSALKALHDENGTTHQTTVPDTFLQIGVAEHPNRLIIESARTRMRHNDVDQVLWADAIETAVYIKNRVNIRALSFGNTPHELGIGHQPEVSHMRVFASTCWVVWNKSHIDGKLDDKAAAGDLLGYQDGRKTYTVIRDYRSVVKVRRIVFCEKRTSEVA